jgi:hypothetical protein
MTKAALPGLAFAFYIGLMLSFGVAAASGAEPSLPASDGLIKSVEIHGKTFSLPPQKAGCYRHVSGQWQEVACLSAADRAQIPHPDPDQLQESGPPGFVPLSAGILEIDILRYGAETDQQNGGSNKFSLQLNTSTFTGNNGDTDWVQYTYQSFISKSGNQVNALCIWTIDFTVALKTNQTGAGYNNQGCLSVDVQRAPQNGDQPGLTGWVNAGYLGVIAVLPWATGGGYEGGADAFATSAQDQYGLGTAANWNLINGGFLGAGGSSKATLTKSCMTVGLTFVPVANVPLPNFLQLPTGNTGESSNLAPVATAGGAMASNCVGSGGPPNAQGYCGLGAYCVQPPVGEGGGDCGVTFDEVSTDWTHSNDCYAAPAAVQPLSAGNQSQAFEDDGTQTTIMGDDVHICANGAIMLGVDASNNRFLCSNSLPSSPGALTVDTSTRATFDWDGKQHSVHVCPSDMVMTGWSKTNDWLICEPTTGPAFLPLTGYGATTPDSILHVPEPKHAGGSMHSCVPNGAGGTSAMSGIDDADNVIICFNDATEPNLK